MAQQPHSLLTAVHRPYAAVYADATERLAATGFVRVLGGGALGETVDFTAEDLYKKALQLDDASEWILTATTPTWVQVNGAASLLNGSVTLAKLADLAQATVIGRASGAGTGVPTALSAAQLKTILALVSGDISDFGEAVEDKIGAKVVAGTGISVGYNDTTGETTVTNTASGGAGGFGDVVGPAVSVDSELALFNSTTGKLIKRATTTGLLKAASGVLSAAVAGTDYISPTTQSAIIQIACSDEGTALTTGTNKVKFRMPKAMTVTAVRASLSTAQASGSIFTVDINEGGATILSTKLTIDNTETTSTAAATPPVISDANLADDAEISIDIDQVGDGTAKGLKVSIIGTWA